MSARGIVTAAACAAAVGGFIGCDEQAAVGVALAPSRAIVAAGTGSFTSLESWAAGCLPVLRPTADLHVVVTTTAASVFVDRVSVHLLDGTNVGGPAITFPRADLDARFGSTLVRARSGRAFTFGSAFACVPFGAKPLRTDVVVVDDSGVRQSLSASAAFR